MTLAEAIQTRIQTLSPSLQRETLDFIEFLEHRYNQEPEKGGDTEAFLAAVAGTLGDDFPDDIGGDDLGVDTPRQEFD
ncbi:MAG: DUF2281 domain-containing protein [Gallionella sp.]|nr:DUF2281 domain-containing protein [Pseudomonadota bacterium]MDZ4202837.1 DUF2281 domain-containing protein [Gallionella sp.]